MLFFSGLVIIMRFTLLASNDELRMKPDICTPSVYGRQYPYSPLGIPKGITASSDCVVIVPEGSRLYLTILRRETKEVKEALRSGQFQELMEVDLSLVPYTKQHAPKNWLTGLISRTMGIDPLNLIHIPLVNGYECCFMPISAFEFPEISLSYQMKCARQNRVGREYEQWIFPLWEYVLRNGSLRTEADQRNSGSIVKHDGTSRSSFGYVIKLLWKKVLYFWHGKPSGTGKRDYEMVTSDREPCAVDSEDHYTLRRYFRLYSSSLSCRVLQGRDTMEVEIGSPEHQQALHRGFLDWIEVHGFDDLAVNVNIYSLTNRFNAR